MTGTPTRDLIITTTDVTRGEGLEGLFLDVSPELCACNPFLSEAGVDTLLGVGTRSLPLGSGAQEDLVRRHRLTRLQRDHFIARERRRGPWRAFLARQELDDDQLVAVAARDRGPHAMSRLAMHLDSHPGVVDPYPVLDRATGTAALWYLATHPGSFPEAAPHWLARWASECGGHTALLALFEVRPDLAEVCVTHSEDLGPARERVTRVLANSAILQRADLQCRMLGLGPDGEVPEDWFRSAYQITGAIVAAVANPLTQRSVIEALQHAVEERVAHLQSWRRIRIDIAARLSDPRDVAGVDLATVSDDETIGLLCSYAQRLFTRPPVPVHWNAPSSEGAGWSALIRNPRVRARRPMLARQIEAAVASWLASREGSFNGDRVLPGGYDAAAPADLARALAGRIPPSEQIDAAHLAVDDVGWLMTRDFYDHAEVRVADWILERLGARADRYRVLLDLVTTWEGTLDELLETITGLVN